MAVGWNLFHAIAHAADSVVHTFSHVVHDLGPFGVVLATSMGLPEIAGAGAADLLMKAHAGNPAAKAKVKEVLARGGNWPAFLTRMAQQLKAHPDFHQFSRHAKATAVHGLTRPGSPTPFSNTPGRGGGGSAYAQPGPSLPPQRQEPDDMGVQHDDTSDYPEFRQMYQPGGYGVDAGDF